MNSRKVRIIGLVLSALVIGQAAQAMELDKEALGNKLLIAAEKNNAEEVIKLLERGADINVQQ